MFNLPVSGEYFSTFAKAECWIPPSFQVVPTQSHPETWHQERAWWDNKWESFITALAQCTSSCDWLDVFIFNRYTGLSVTSSRQQSPFRWVMDTSVWIRDYVFTWRGWAQSAHLRIQETHFGQFQVNTVACFPHAEVSINISTSTRPTCASTGWSLHIALRNLWKGIQLFHQIQGLLPIQPPHLQQTPPPPPSYIPSNLGINCCD